MLHPIMPHITEEIWQLIPGSAYKNDSAAIMLAKYPQFEPKFENAESENDMNLVIETIRSLRNIRQTLNIPVSSRIND